MQLSPCLLITLRTSGKSLGNQEDAAGKVDKAYKEMSATIIASLKRLQNTATAVVVRVLLKISDQR